jgi:hypothetical protein
MNRTCLFAAFVALTCNLYAEEANDDTRADASRVENANLVSVENLSVADTLPELKTEVIAPIPGLWAEETRIPPLPVLELNNTAPSLYPTSTLIFPPVMTLDCQCFVPEISYLTESRPSEFRPTKRKLTGTIQMQGSYSMPELSYLSESKTNNFPSIKPKLSCAVPRQVIDSTSELSYLSESRPR